MGALHLASITRCQARLAERELESRKENTRGPHEFFSFGYLCEVQDEQQKDEDNKTQTKVSASIAGVTHKRVASGVCQHLEGWEMR